MKTILISQKKLAILLGIVTAPVIFFSTVAPALADKSMHDAMKKNCSSFNKQKDGNQIDIRSIDPETGVLYVNQPVNGIENIVPMDYKMGDADERGCNEGARSLFADVRRVEKKQIDDSCADFKDILSGKKPNVSKDGEVGNLAAAQSFVSKHCK